VDLRERRVARASAILGAARERHAMTIAALERRERQIAEARAALAALSRDVAMGEVGAALIETALARMRAIDDTRNREIEAHQVDLAAKIEAEGDCHAADLALRLARGRLEAVTQWKVGFVKDHMTATERRAELDAPPGRAATVIAGGPWN
jgi:hypothetical protein